RGGDGCQAKPLPRHSVAPQVLARRRIQAEHLTAGCRQEHISIQQQASEAKAPVPRKIPAIIGFRSAYTAD
ncbi:MAG: hypothetical protein LAP21_21080, partial [Acidobacteriia bacterium]|nr:hypothetical protein [Terriglobia bacterium]